MTRSTADGPLEPTNEPYAIAKIAGIKLCQAYRAVRCELHLGDADQPIRPNDNFDSDSSHVLPALIRKFHDAKVEGRREVTTWGRARLSANSSRRRPRRRVPVPDGSLR
jgi:GDP-L-fucose synthase